MTRSEALRAIAAGATIAWATRLLTRRNEKAGMIRLGGVAGRAFLRVIWLFGPLTLPQMRRISDNPEDTGKESADIVRKIFPSLNGEFEGRFLSAPPSARYRPHLQFNDLHGYTINHSQPFVSRSHISDSRPAPASARPRIAVSRASFTPPKLPYAKGKRSALRRRTCSPLTGSVNSRLCARSCRFPSSARLPSCECVTLPACPYRGSPQIGASKYSMVQRSW